ncbi:AAA family ATPase [Gimesia aquarii]|uniref:ATP-dependent zinc metalloprotease FtsH n=1 Tax=Gimesia aquarii TaxID=2527964 RepID=A0A517W3P2_9PLAN|nr:AAA family ATPase [Gimesia aquarii]QDT99874.1 ATP-dependent zinc metalloprotease FtsH [Gimesia aquarii]
MATAQQIKALLKSYGESDNEMFLSVALQIAAHEARSGKGKLGSELKKLVDEIQEKQRSAKISGTLPIARPSGELATLLAASYPKTHINDMVLSEDQQAIIHQVVIEYRQHSKLREHGLSAKRKLLLVGPPGVGKTMTSWALAGELKLPLFTVQFHSLITKFMGETAAKLFAIFEAMYNTPGVYLFDEFDAIGAVRSASNDVGEIRRVLNSFLQFLDQDDSDSLIIAATNLNEMLDEALFRRFDEIITYHIPDNEEINQLIANRLSAFNTKNLNGIQISKKAEGLSHAEICRACDEAAKEAVLNNRRSIRTETLIREVEARLKRKI